MRILVLTKRQYMHKDLLDDRYGRFREIPLALSEMGHEVKGLCLSYATKPEGRIWDAKVCWQSINAGSLKIAGLMRFVTQAARSARDADVIWACSDSFYGIIGRWVARKARIPFVFDLYDNFEYYLIAQLPVFKQLYCQSVNASDFVTCISAPLKDLVVSYRRTGPVEVLENGVRTDLFRPLDKADCRRLLGLPLDATIIGTAGALQRNLGIGALYQAFNLLKPQNRDLHLVVAGPRDILPPHGDRIHDLGILPFEKVPILLNALDVAVICNRNNLFGQYCYPQKAGEIMSCDVPLVVSRVGSMAQLFNTHPEWLFEPDNSESLASAISARIQNRATGYPTVYTWELLAERLERYMVSLLSSN